MTKGTVLIFVFVAVVVFVVVLQYRFSKKSGDGKQENPVMNKIEDFYSK